MTLKLLIDFLGGVRAAIFAGVALVLFLALGVQTWRVHSAKTDVAELRAKVAEWQAAQATNLETIDNLQARLVAMVKAREAEAQAQEDAVAAAQKRAKVLQATLNARTRELEKLYARDPNAARWGAAPVPVGVLRNLPDAD